MLAAMLLLSACSKKQDVPEAAFTEQGTEVKTHQEERKAEEEVKEAEPEIAAPQETKPEYQKGVVTENGWESAYLGLCYHVPEGMYMSTEEEQAAMTGLGEELLSENFGELQMRYTELVSCCEMMSLNAAGTVNLLITTEEAADTGLNAEAYADSLREQLAKMDTVAYRVSGENERAVVGGEEFVKLSCEADFGGVSMCQDYYIGILKGRAVSIVVTYMAQVAELAGRAIDGVGSF